jgi:predicted permease
MRRTRATLIAIEVAASLALLVGSGLMVRSALNLRRVDLGYRVEGIVRSRIVLPGRTYADPISQERFYSRFLQEARSSSGALVALTNWPPFAEPLKRPVVTAERPDALTSGVMAVSDGYFGVLGVPILRGRNFTPADRLDAPPVAIVSETLARTLWPAQMPMGQRVRVAESSGAPARPSPWREVIGVVRDVRNTYTDEDQRDLYIPFMQAPERFTPFYARTTDSAASWLTQLRAVVSRIDPEVTINGANLLQTEADRLTAGSRFLTAFLAAFATASILIAVFGLYGVVQYSVEQRRLEVAIRMAVGASPTAVVRLFIREGAATIGCGVIAGLVAAWWLARLLTSQLHDVRPFDPATIMAMTGLLVICSYFATWWPAHRAAMENSVSALKEG